MKIRLRERGLLLALGLMGAASPAGAETARAALGLVVAAADAWADDARLAWIENDAPVDAQGQADAWGYLYYSPSKHAMRSWSVRGARIVQAKDQAVIAAAPAIDPAWRDSDAIVAAAFAALLDDEPLAAGTRLESLVLVRGVFGKGTCWVAVFDMGSGPRVFLLLDAVTGAVTKRWRG